MNKLYLACYLSPGILKTIGFLSKYCLCSRKVSYIEYKPHSLKEGKGSLRSYEVCRFEKSPVTVNFKNKF